MDAAPRSERDAASLNTAIEDKATGFELHGTNLEALPPNLLLNFERPREVDLCGNRLTALPSDLFAAGAGIKKLAVCRNQLQSLPACVAAVQCPKLFLQQNRISTLENLPSNGLVSLDASSNALSGVLELRNLPTLQKLCLRGNDISGLQLENVPMLASVDVSLNKLAELPLAPGQMLSEVLTTLNVAENRLLALPDALTQCSRLLELNVASNRLTRLPEGLGALGSLRKLSVQRNALTELPASLWSLKSLLELNASRNCLTTLPATPPPAASSDHNSGGAPAVYLPLVEICVARNQLTKIDDALAAALPSLTRLDVSHNALTALPPGLRSLRYLVAHYNRLATLSSQLEGCPRLQSVLARGNPLGDARLLSPPSSTASALSGAAAEYELTPLFGQAPDNSATTPEVAVEAASEAAGWRTLVSHVAPLPVCGMRLSGGVALMNGRRRSMEDRASLELMSAGARVAGSGGHPGAGAGAAGATTPLLDRVVCIAGVYDGHGGDEASAMVVQALPDALRTALASTTAKMEGAEAAAEAAAVAMSAAFKAVAERIAADEEGTYGWVGTTATVAMVIAGDARAEGEQACVHLVVGNVGDSDAVLYTRSAAGEEATTAATTITTPTATAHAPWVCERVSTRHRPDARAEEERITANGGYVSEEGSLNDMIAVARFLGDAEHPPPRCAVPSVRVRRLDAATSFNLVLASDGLWDVVDEAEVPSLLAESKEGASGRDAEEQAAVLRDEAFLRGSTDNVTVCVLAARTMRECRLAL